MIPLHKSYVGVNTHSLRRLFIGTFNSAISAIKEGHCLYDFNIVNPDMPIWGTSKAGIIIRDFHFRVDTAEFDYNVINSFADDKLVFITARNIFTNYETYGLYKEVFDVIRV